MSVGDLHASTTHLLNVVLPKILRNFGEDLVPLVIKLYCVCPITEGLFSNARLEEGSNTKASLRNDKQVYYVFNAKGFIMKGHDITGVKVTKTRIKNEAAASKTTLHFVSVDPSCPDSPEAYEGPHGRTNCTPDPKKVQMRLQAILPNGVVLRPRICYPWCVIWNLSVCNEHINQYPWQRTSTSKKT